MIRYINALVRMAAVVPDEPLAADKWSEDISDAIEVAISDLGRGIVHGSVDVIDWTEEEG